MFTNLVGWQAGAVSFPLSDIILVHKACPLIDIMFSLHSGITNYLSTNNAGIHAFLATAINYECKMIIKQGSRRPSISVEPHPECFGKKNFSFHSSKCRPTLKLKNNFNKHLENRQLVRHWCREMIYKPQLF